MTPDPIVVLASIVGAATLLTVLAQACVHLWLRGETPAVGGSPPGVTILRPLKGVDDGLWENLVSLALQDHPRLQILLGAADPLDPALDAARRLQREFPSADIEVVEGAPEAGLNPKVTNLMALTRRARHPLLLVSDSNVRCDPTYVSSVVAEILQPRVAAVCSIFVGRGERSLGALLENLQLNSWVPAGMCASQVLTGDTPVVGKSLIFRKEDLDRVGGWSTFQDVLAEDYVLGTRLAADGRRLITSRHLVTTVNGTWTLQHFLNRHLRWDQLRRHLALPAFLAEPILNPVPFAMALLVTRLWAVGALLVLVKVLSDALLARRLRGSWYPLAYWLAIPPKDCVILALWVVAAFRTKVVWRGRALRIGKGTALLPEPDQVPALCLRDGA